MTNEEIISVVKAHSEGKFIQCRSKIDGSWHDLLREPVWDFDSYDYRIKPKSSIRPYTFDELCEAVKKHGGYIRGKSTNILNHIDYATANNIDTNDSDEMLSYNDLLQYYTWNDDNSPCGIIE